MDIKLTKNCVIECWSGITDSYIEHEKGDIITTNIYEEEDGYLIVNNENYGDMYIPKDCVIIES